MSIRRRFDLHWTPEPNSGCWLWIGAQRSNGYGSFRMGHVSTRNRRIESAHRVSWIINKGHIPDGLCVLHRCDTPLCVNPGHLFLGTIADNNRDMAKKGRVARSKWPSEKHHFTKLTRNQVEQIRASPLKQSETAKIFGITQSHVSRLKSREVWKRDS